jgi:hypothetical protein
MIIRIKYQDPSNPKTFITESLDSSQINVPEYCTNLHKTVLCDIEECDGENCKIWVEVNGEFVLAGIPD